MPEAPILFLKPPSALITPGPGQCIEVPSEPEESGFCAKIKLKGYPLIKIGDVLWTHMGDKENRPPEPT